MGHESKAVSPLRSATAVHNAKVQTPYSRDFLNCQQHKLQPAAFLIEAAGVDDQTAFAKFREFVFEPEIAHFALARQILLDQLPEARDVPLPLVQVKQGFVLDLLGTDMEGAAKGVVYATDL